MPANVDFARLNFQVPTAGSATDSAAMATLWLVRSAPRSALKRTSFTNVFLQLISRLLVVLLRHSVSATVTAVVASRAPVVTTAGMLIRVFIAFFPGLVRRTVHPISPVAEDPVDRGRGDGNFAAANA